jgi:acyl-CoA reductase-like NAD-dependent aldehyde dehydrogenase
VSAQRRVEALLRVAADLAARPDPGLERALAESTGLSAQGVRFGVDRCLERAVGPADLARLLASVRPASAVAVVLSANVFTASLRALCLAAAAAPRVYVRPSRRDPHFAAALVERLGAPEITLVESLAQAGEASVVHAYGRDETLRAILRERGLPVWAHGAGLGVAVVSREAPLEAAAHALAEDLVAFDQRGCLSPRVALSIGEPARARDLAATLSAALASWEARVPTGALTAAERAERLRARDTALLVGEVHEGSAGALVAVPELDARAPLLVFPPGRNLAVVPVHDEAEARARVASLGRAVVTVGASDLGTARAIAPPWARLAELGQMQRPPLDGPVDGRDVWLTP